MSDDEAQRRVEEEARRRFEEETRRRQAEELRKQADAERDRAFREAQKGILGGDDRGDRKGDSDDE